MSWIGSIALLCTLGGCGGSGYDWNSTRGLLDKEIPSGTPLSRAFVVIDSLGGVHGEVRQGDSVVIARLREPNFGSKTIFSTLRVFLSVDSTGVITGKDFKVVLTGP